MKSGVRNPVSFIAGSMAIAALVLASASTARAAGLGELRLASELGQPLKAEIDIVSVQTAEKDLAVRLAPSVHQAGAGIDPALSSIRFAIVRRGERSVLLVSTRQPVNGPYLELPIELRSNTAKVTRRYTLLLNPPSIRGASVAAVSLQK